MDQPFESDKIRGSSTAHSTAFGGTGGQGGAGGHGGHALNITYTDNYSLLMLAYTYLLYQEKKKYDQASASTDLLMHLEALIQEERSYRQEFLKTIRSVQRISNNE
ncbi:hypothetical protein [Brevibacillus dissolubilis]|uniref:hypothetical protein n=1 Tax=Brevibacillus dissolubilis TaxID=1844116 RepID=UPI0011168E55|nr:hypothetical protein [Brevibacillus dissolubilis]